VFLESLEIMNVNDEKTVSIVGRVLSLISKEWKDEIELCSSKDPLIESKRSSFISSIEKIRHIKWIPSVSFSGKKEMKSPCDVFLMPLSKETLSVDTRVGHYRIPAVLLEASPRPLVSIPENLFELLLIKTDATEMEVFVFVFVFVFVCFCFCFCFCFCLLLFLFVVVSFLCCWINFSFLNNRFSNCFCFL